MDKVKATAEEALAAGQQAAAQGQSKLNEIQAAKTREGLLRNLGAAYYNQQRSNGPAEAVAAAFAALDAHDFPQGPGTPQTPPPAPPPSPPAS